MKSDRRGGGRESRGVAATSEARQLRTSWLVDGPMKSDRRGGGRESRGVAATSEARQLRTSWLVDGPMKSDRRGGERMFTGIIEERGVVRSAGSLLDTAATEVAEDSL